MPRFEVDVTFTLEADNAEQAWMRVFGIMSDAEFFIRRRFPSWELLEDAAREVA